VKEQHKVRFAGIDNPEKQQPVGNGPKCHFSSLVAGKQRTVEFFKFDRYLGIVGKAPVPPWEWGQRKRGAPR